MIIIRSFFCRREIKKTYPLLIQSFIVDVPNYSMYNSCFGFFSENRCQVKSFVCKSIVEKSWRVNHPIDRLFAATVIPPRGPRKRRSWGCGWVVSSAPAPSRVPKVPRAYRVRAVRVPIAIVLTSKPDIPGNQEPPVARRTIDRHVRQRAASRSRRRRHRFRRNRRRSWAERTRQKARPRRKASVPRRGTPAKSESTQFVIIIIIVIQKISNYSMRAALILTMLFSEQFLKSNLFLNNIRRNRPSQFFWYKCLQLTASQIKNILK